MKPILLFLFLPAACGVRGQSERIKIDTTGKLLFNSSATAGRLSPSDTIPQWLFPISFLAIEDSTGEVARRDMSGNWTFTDPAKALEVMYQSYQRDIKERNLLLDIIYYVRRDGSGVSNWKKFNEAVNAYYIYKKRQQ